MPAVSAKCGSSAGSDRLQPESHCRAADMAGSAFLALRQQHCFLVRQQAMVARFSTDRQDEAEANRGLPANTTARATAMSSLSLASWRGGCIRACGSLMVIRNRQKVLSVGACRRPPVHLTPLATRDRLI
jgi:hypothetical protein